MLMVGEGEESWRGRRRSNSIFSRNHDLVLHIHRSLIKTLAHTTAFVTFTLAFHLSHYTIYRLHLLDNTSS